MRRIIAFIIVVVVLIVSLGAYQDYLLQSAIDEQENSVMIFPGVVVKKRPDMKKYLYLHEGMLHVYPPTSNANEHWKKCWEVSNLAVQIEIEHRIK